jgi:hypothetical protein
MFEMTLGDEDMQLLKLQPNGPIDGVPSWSVVSGNGTLLGDPAVWDAANAYPEIHAEWQAGGMAEGFQMFVVSETLPNGEAGPLHTEYAVQADVDLGPGMLPLTESVILHTINLATTLGIVPSAPIKKPSPLP